jgi:dimeric dUTPase (all-alpha-NTP-PPase superfamily)
MDIKKMIGAIEKTEINSEFYVSKINRNLINLYNNKEIGNYTEILNDMLLLAVYLKYELILKYFGTVPIVSKDETIQFQRIFKCIATRNRNKDWFLNLFPLFLGLASIFRFDMSEIEKIFFEKKGL